MSITSDEVNFLVYRYLQESGFMHSAFTFAYESQLTKSTVVKAEIPPGALVSYLQKGLQYVGIEAHINDDGTERICDGEISLLNPHICRVAKSINSTNAPKQLHSGKVSNKRKRKNTTPTVTPTSTSGTLLSTTEEHSPTDDGVNEVTPSVGSPTEVNGVTDSNDDQKVLVLNGHEKEVFFCAWNPIESNQLATGSSDSTARIWSLPKEKLNLSDSNVAPITLKHGVEDPTSDSVKHEESSRRDVTTLEWHPDGKSLATGTFNGNTHIWSANGELKQRFKSHSGPVFATRWSATGKFLATASFDKTVAIWDANKESIQEQVELHNEAILDISWKDDSMYASCSSDKQICVNCVGSKHALGTFKGHKKAINSIKWAPFGRLLASCSDDYTIKLWEPTKLLDKIPSPADDDDDERMSEPVTKEKPIQASASPAGDLDNALTRQASVSSSFLHSLEDHKKEVYTFRWSTTGPGTDLPNGSSTLASASIDSTVKIWDVEAAQCRSTFEHQNSVYAVAYCPSGDLLASGTLRGILNIWSLKDSKILKTYQINGDIYEVNWDKTGNLIAACTTSGDVAVIDMRL